MFQIGKCRKFTAEYEGFITKTTNFIVQRTSSTFHVENIHYLLKM